MYAGDVVGIPRPCCVAGTQVGCADAFASAVVWAATEISSGVSGCLEGAVDIC